MRSGPMTIRGKGLTVGVQTIAICALLLPANCTASVEMVVGCLSNDNLGGAVTRKTAIKKIAGVLTNLGDLEATVLKGDAGLAGVTIAPVFNNGYIELQVTGIAGKTINWSGLFSAQVHVNP